LLIRECTWTYNGSCYYLSDHKEEFFAAESECAVKYAGHLIAVTSEEESNFIAVQLLNEFGSYPILLWIGGFQDGDEEWNWTSSYEDWNFTNWDLATGQPSLGTNACASFSQGKNWRWSDHRCSTLHNFICESVIHNQ